MSRLSRRRVLAGAGATIATVLFTEEAARAAPDVPVNSRAARVVHDAGDRVEVEVLDEPPYDGPTVVARQGFPPGWELRPGDLVILGGPRSAAPGVVQPLVTRLVGRFDPASAATTGSRPIGTTTIELRPQTVRRARAVRDARVTGPLFEAFCIENAADGKLSCVSLRPATG